MKAFRVFLPVAAATIGLAYLGWNLSLNSSADVFAVLRINNPRYLVPDARRFSFAEFVESQKKLLLSHEVLSEAVSRLSATSPALLNDVSDPAGYLAEHIETSPITLDHIEIRLTGDEFTAKERVKLLGAVIDAYLTSQKANEGTQFVQLMSRLNFELKQLRSEHAKQVELLNKARDEQSTETELLQQVEEQLGRRCIDAQRAFRDKLASRSLDMKLNSESPLCVSLVDAPAVRTASIRWSHITNKR